MRYVHAGKGRYYETHVVRDLFDTWTVVRVWGGLGSRRGGQRIEVVGSQAEAEQAVARISKRRQQRGYVAQPPG